MSDQANRKFIIDAEGLTRHVNHSDSPIWWGVVGLILIELSVVSAFCMSYVYLRMMNNEWPPSGVELPDIVLPSWSLALMLISCVTMYLSGKSLDKNKVEHFVVYTFTSVALAATVLFIRWQQFSHFELAWNEHVYGSLMWTINGFHFTHIVSAVIGTFVIGLFGLVGFFNKKRQIGVVVDTLYWNFVAIAWIPFYIVLYIVPRL